MRVVGKYDFTIWEESTTLTLLDGRIQKLGHCNRENSATGTLQDRMIQQLGLEKTRGVRNYNFTILEESATGTLQDGRSQ